MTAKSFFIMIRNRLKHWRFKFEMKQTEFAVFLSLNYSQYNRYEKNPDKYSPDSETMWKIWKRIKSRFPDAHLEDMWEESANKSTNESAP